MLSNEELLAVFLSQWDVLKKSEPIPQHTSCRTGKMYCAELLETDNPARFRDAARMDKITFRRLIKLLKRDGGLKNSRYISCEQKLFILVDALVGLSVRQIGEKWQHSTSTISTCLHEIVACFISLRHKLFIKPTADGLRISKDNGEKFAPFYDGCIGALDGSHIPAVLPVDEQSAFRNRKGFISQNLLAVVNFDGTFSYCLAGWEGSAHDGRVLGDAVLKKIPLFHNKYFLADAGYALTRMTLTPYRGVRYHLKEWVKGNRRPQSREELFNLRHSSLRNVIERTFGVVKKRFPYLDRMHAYDYPMQVDLVLCCFMIHNFIRLNQEADDEYDAWEYYQILVVVVSGKYITIVLLKLIPNICILLS